jgi:thiol-disulfide isomerase/thioredoxin
MCQLRKITLDGLLLVSVSALLFPNLSCAETPFAPFKAPDLAVRQWLTPDAPQKGDLIGRPYVIEFWATWCPPCQQSVKHMIDLQNKYASKGLIIIALSQDTSPDNVRTFITEKHINYNVAMDPGTLTEFAVTQVPTVFIVDHHGEVVWRGFPWDRSFEDMVKKVLDEAPPAVTGGVHLGAYENYKPQLQGGTGFAVAYDLIKAQSQTPGNPNVATARSIILAIDVTIGRKINQAHSLRHTDPASAFRMYALVVQQYAGIPVTKPAADAIIAMKAAREVKPELYASIAH